MQHDPVTLASDGSEQLLRVVGGYALSAALYVAVELEIADHLASGPRTVADLAERTGTKPDALYRVLRALASADIFTETKAREFALTPAASLLRGDGPASMRGIARMLCDPVHFEVYGHAMDTLRTGIPAIQSATGLSAFEYFAKHPEYSTRFNDAMTSLSAAVIPAVLEAYDFSDASVVADIAGGHGHVLSSILKKYPAMRGILTDVGHVIEGARVRIENAGLARRCEAIAMDFFESAPQGADVYVMKGVIHDWDDEHARLILENVRKAMGSKRGRVTLIEALLRPGNEPHFANVLDLEMLMWVSGRERTEAEFRALFDSAGFELTRIVPTRSPMVVVEGRKAL